MLQHRICAFGAYWDDEVDWPDQVEADGTHS